MKREAVNLAQKLAQFDDLWSPRIVAAFNGHDVMVVKVMGSLSGTRIRTPTTSFWF